MVGPMFTDAEWDLISELMRNKQKLAIEEGRLVAWSHPATGRDYWVHNPDKCRGERCVFHNPTPHSMSDRPIVIRETGLIERTCIHGIGHPDPDSQDYMDRTTGQGYGVHGCDGCCSSRSVPSS